MPVSSAGAAKQFVTTESTQNAFRQDERSLTPTERIRLSERKVQENPSLRGRWTPKSRQPASEGSGISDNLAEKILSNFREEEELSKIPAYIKVKSQSGTVVLEGVVNSENEKELITDKVGKMEGVKKVVNELKIKSSDKDLLS